MCELSPFRAPMGGLCLAHRENFEGYVRLQEGKTVTVAGAAEGKQRQQ